MASSTASSSSSSSPLRSVSSLPFSRLSRLLSRLSELRRADKLRRVRELFHQLGYEAAADGDGGLEGAKPAGAAAAAASRLNLFPLLRLLLPQLDTERATYGLRESSLAEMYIGSLSLDRSSAVAQRLRHFKQPQGAGGAGTAGGGGGGGGTVVAGDFASVLLDVLRPRERVREGCSRLSIADVNGQLDAIAAGADRSTKQAVFIQLTASLSASEHFWIVRVILKDLKVGLKHESLLRLLHPLAVDVYNSCSSLRHVCELLTEPARLVAEASNVGYFRPFKPMLAQSPSDWNNIPRMMDGRRYVIEDKFDGERMIMHKRGSDVRLYTRKSIDVTHRYGYGAALAATLLECVMGDAIIDGELMSWDITLQRYVPFGNNRTTALLGEHTNRQLTYLAFDLIMDGDSLLIDRPLLERKKRLAQLVKERQHAVEVVRTKEARADTQYLLDHLNDAVYRGMEGLVLKAAGGQYGLNERSASWIKFKPDFVSGLHDTLDLLLVGGYYGEGTLRGGDISHFLLAVVEKVNLQANEQPRRFYTFCKVGSGYTIPELNELRDRLRDKWRPYDKRRPPSWLQGWRPEPSDVPDVLIEPRDSLIVAVKCYEIIPCPASKFLAEFTCRFPRVTSFRYNDKHWYEAESIDAIRQLAARDRVKGRKMDEEATVAAGQRRQPFSQDGSSPPHSPTSDMDEADGGGASQLDGQWGLAGQLAASQEAGVDGGKKGGRKRGRQQLMPDEASPGLAAASDDKAAVAGQRRSAAAGGVLPLFQAASGLSGIERRSSLFDGWSVVVMVQPDCQPSKAELERLVVQHGGEVRQNPPAQLTSSPSATRARCVLLSDGKTSYKLQAHQRSGRFDIVHISWLLQSVERGRLLRYKHEQLISATTATSSERSRQVDRYGDDYTEDVHSLDDIRLLVQAVQRSRRGPYPFHRSDRPASTDSTATETEAGQTGQIKTSPSSASPSPVSSLSPTDAIAAAADCPSRYRSLSSADQRVAGLRAPLFDGVQAALLLDKSHTAAAAEAIGGQSVDAAIVRCALLLNGAQLLDEADSASEAQYGAMPTHWIVMEPGADERERDEWQARAARVAPSWVTASLQNGQRQNEEEHSPRTVASAN